MTTTTRRSVKRRLTKRPGSRSQRTRQATLAALTEALVRVVAAVPAPSETPAPAPVHDPGVLVARIPAGQTSAQVHCSLLAAGVVSNAAAVRYWSTGVHGFDAVDITAMVDALAAAGERLNTGDLSQVEALLTAQASSLNAVYTHLLWKARQTNNIEVFERCLRLALRAQGQCRATGETLATIKNPPAVFARQANIANGPQQVNNHAAARGVAPATRVVDGPATATRAGGEGPYAPNRLLTESSCEGMDDGTAAPAAAGDLPLAALGTLDGTTDAGGQGPGVAERVPGRPAAGVPRVHADPAGCAADPGIRA